MRWKSRSCRKAAGRSPHTWHNTPFMRRSRDFGLTWGNMSGGGSKFAVGVLQLVATAVLTLLSVYLLLSGRLSAGVLGFFLFTAIIFGIAACQTRAGWRSWSYWTVLLACLAAHTLTVGFLGAHLMHLPTMVLGIFATFECGGVYLLLRKVGG